MPRRRTPALPIFALSSWWSPPKAAPRARSSRAADDGTWVCGVSLGPAGSRHYRLFKPGGLRFNERLPLLVMLHGCGQTAAEFASSTRMDRLAKRHRFLLLYPEQDRRANLHGCWNWYDTDGRGAFREAATLLAALDQVCRLYPVDVSRVAVAGLSAGASMAALLATLYPERFGAVAMHSGVAPGTAHSAGSALKAMRGRSPLPPTEHPTGQDLPPLLVIHGAADRIVAPSNGANAAALWADRGLARPSAKKTRRLGQRHPMAVTEYRSGRRLVATLCEVEHLAHAWSGGAAGRRFSDAKGPSASSLIWSFAARQFRIAAKD